MEIRKIPPRVSTIEVTLTQEDFDVLQKELETLSKKFANSASTPTSGVALIWALVNSLIHSVNGQTQRL